jgi:hypothetical protein
MVLNSGPFRSVLLAKSDILRSCCRQSPNDIMAQSAAGRAGRASTTACRLFAVEMPKSLLDEVIHLPQRPQDRPDRKDGHDASSFRQSQNLALWGIMSCGPRSISAILRT